MAQGVLQGAWTLPRGLPDAEVVLGALTRVAAPLGAPTTGGGFSLGWRRSQGRLPPGGSGPPREPSHGWGAQSPTIGGEPARTPGVVVAEPSGAAAHPGPYQGRQHPHGPSLWVATSLEGPFQGRRCHHRPLKGSRDPKGLPVAAPKSPLPGASPARALSGKVGPIGPARGCSTPKASSRGCGGPRCSQEQRRLRALPKQPGSLGALPLAVAPPGPLPGTVESPCPPKRRRRLGPSTVGGAPRALQRRRRSQGAEPTAQGPLTGPALPGALPFALTGAARREPSRGNKRGPSRGSGFPKKGPTWGVPGSRGPLRGNGGHRCPCRGLWSLQGAWTLPRDLPDAEAVLGALTRVAASLGALPREAGHSLEVAAIRDPYQGQWPQGRPSHGWGRPQESHHWPANLQGPSQGWWPAEPSRGSGAPGALPGTAAPHGPLYGGNVLEALLRPAVPPRNPPRAVGPRSLPGAAALPGALPGGGIACKGTQEGGAPIGPARGCSTPKASSRGCGAPGLSQERLAPSRALQKRRSAGAYRAVAPPRTLQELQVPCPPKAAAPGSPRGLGILRAAPHRIPLCFLSCGVCRTNCPRGPTGSALPGALPFCPYGCGARRGIPRRQQLHQRPLPGAVAKLQGPNLGVPALPEGPLRGSLAATGVPWRGLWYPSGLFRVWRPQGPPQARRRPWGTLPGQPGAFAGGGEALLDPLKGSDAPRAPDMGCDVSGEPY
ncbi:collagen alpha-1(I) chain-like [Homarus americanus]|uniref:collagen alpha-1(I) chain-like n=1 Tax=Homarus americanus TaxID=6706 RepID=UPI001C465051|nr:collagen alpha-1(I) chain-like [Homarus americanus]